MRKFFTKKLALAVIVSSLLTVQISGVAAAAAFSDVMSNYATSTDTTPSDSTESDTPTDTTETDTTTNPSDATGSDTITDIPEGNHSLPITVTEDEIIEADEVDEKLENEVKTSEDSKIEVVSDAAPELSAELFSAVKVNNKDITVSVVNSQNYLLYAWTFKAATLTNTDKNVDLSLNVTDVKNDKIVELTGEDELVYLNFAYHGELPGTATLHTYVGKWFQNGDVVYLYYYNEELGRIEVVGDNEGLKVTDGYVDFDIDHCSVYFLSGHTADEVKAIDPATGEIANAPIATGDHANIMLYVLLSVAAICAIGLVVVFNKKRAY